MRRRWGRPAAGALSARASRLPVRATAAYLGRVTFSASYLHQILHFAALRGADAGALRARAGLPRSWAARDGTERHPEATYNALLEGAVAATGDPWFGLHLGDWMNLTAAGLVGQIAGSCPDLGAALEHLCAYANLGCEALPLRLERGPRETALVLEPDPGWVLRAPEAARQTEEFFLAFGVRQLGWLTLFESRPVGADLRRGRPADPGPVERLVGGRLRFARTRTVLWIRGADLARPLPGASAELLPLLVAEAERRQSARPGETPTVAAVRRVLGALQGEGFPTLAAVADALHASPRTLQRRLDAEGTGYRELLEAVQDERARHFLRQGKRTLAEVAWLSGYRDAASLTRAFRRRHGMPPSRWRAGAR